MNTDIGDLFLQQHKQITELRVKTLVHESLLKAIMSTLPEDATNHIAKSVCQVFNKEISSEAGDELKRIALDYLEQSFRIR
ncbi:MULTISPECIES: hypothetical protein [Citrobacter freundii complex]|uniref:hypothetical protein n=1 Tax=Citrobacter freundii complex TaxID=1344959 RepID=UPI00045661E9|nr:MULTISPECIES: hypothetical protein [Citrobacter]AHY13546.1 hypothetical protein CFNIH1_19040 [Citrobacter freundii CFNIH1]EIP1105491.1 hypothetical protein [Citrobacter freundii]EJD6095537.1 hypothetical protein [Citrobacter freundii]EKS9217974.1 hypothetical protein [Citrobacter freundii]MBJ8412861.1 hypothetical protein [Citrobacter cronae]